MNFIIRILGSSGAFPTFERFSTAHFVSVYQKHFLIDCGEGTQIQLKRFKTKFGKINNIFISHLHGDHFFGLLGLISSYNLSKRTTDLNIYAPADLEKILFSENSFFRRSELSFKINFFPHPDENKVIYHDKNLEIECFQLSHNIPTWGFLFREKQRPPNIKKEKITELNLTIEQIKALKSGQDITVGGKKYKNEELTFTQSSPRSYAFCSDTSYYEKIVPIIKNVDLLYHEATFLEKDYSDAVRYRHSTAKQAAMIASKAHAKKLIIGHFSNRYQSVKSIEKEAKEVFQNTIAANDGMKIEILLDHKIEINEHNSDSTMV